MCGIAGFSGQFSKNLLFAMGEKMAHRGPDDHNELYFPLENCPVGLAHRRLSIIDLSAHGQQPMSSYCQCCDGGKQKIWLTYNGEIYNYQALRKELLAKGHTFKSQTDSEVLIHLYAEYGLAMLNKLNGIFAFAIYEGRENAKALKRGDLFLARDGLGVKPCYYAETKEGFIFASELKALLAYGQLNREIDLIALHYYLAYLWCPGEKTALQSVKKLEPGEAFIIRAGRIYKRWFYYDLPYKNQPSIESKQSLIHQLDTKLTQAVYSQLMSDVPLGAFLSGGLDSSAIVAMMRKIKPNEKINCYTIAFAEGMASEGNPNDLPYAKAVAKHLNVDLKVLYMQADMFSHLEKMIYHLDEPQADPAPIHVLLIAEEARRDGIKVLLSGAGGDDIFSGYRRHQALYAERFWTWLPLFLKQKAALLAKTFLEGESRTLSPKNPLARRLASIFAKANLPADQRLAEYFLWNTENLRRNLYSPHMQEKIMQEETITPLLKSLARIPNEKNNLNRILYLEAKHFLPDHNLNYTDKMAMAFGVEVRVPLLDKELIDFAVSLPPHLKQKRMTGKYLLKKTMESYLPKSVIYRPKAGFGAPMRRFIKEEMQDYVQTILSESNLRKRGIFSPKAVHTLIKANQAGKVDAAYTIFSLLCIELWCQQFIGA